MRRCRASSRWTLGVLAALALLGAAGVAAPQSARPEAADTTKLLIADAVAFEHGEGVPKDMLKAAALYCTAARAGNADAQFNLAWMYANGRGVPKDDAAAGALFALAAQSGHAQAR